MRSQPATGRILTVIAVGLLALDGALLGLAGLWSGRLGLLVGGVCFLLTAGGVLYLWQRQRRRLAEIAGERQALRAEAQELSRLLRGE